MLHPLKIMWIGQSVKMLDKVIEEYEVNTIMIVLSHLVEVRTAFTLMLNARV